MICASEARFSSRNESHMWTFAKGENNILWDLTKRLLKKKKKKNTEVCKISKSTWSKVFCLKQKQKYKNKTPIQDAVGYKANVFAPKQGYITLGGVWLGFKRGDSRLRQLLFNNGWVRWFIYLFTSPLLVSPFLCLPALLSKKRGGNLAGKETRPGTASF